MDITEKWLREKCMVCGRVIEKLCSECRRRFRAVQECTDCWEKPYKLGLCRKHLMKKLHKGYAVTSDKRRAEIKREEMLKGIAKDRKARLERSKEGLGCSNLVILAPAYKWDKWNGQSYTKLIENISHIPEDGIVGVFENLFDCKSELAERILEGRRLLPYYDFEDLQWLKKLFVKRSGVYIARDVFRDMTNVGKSLGREHRVFSKLLDKDCVELCFDEKSRMTSVIEGKLYDSRQTFINRRKYTLEENLIRDIREGVFKRALWSRD